MKNCEHCNTPFSPRPNGRKQRFCKSECCRAAYNAKHPGIGYDYALIRDYGISRARFIELLDIQCNRCLICGRDNVKLVVDHDHETGRVRGLLCKSCNGGLGVYEKYKTALLEYLEPTC